uniref:Uncharacterized protein n=1 Tax=Arundo donax TaxID=35708 RepID=A0A0A9BCS2_ARUDO
MRVGANKQINKLHFVFFSNKKLVTK